MVVEAGEYSHMADVAAAGGSDVVALDDHRLLREEWRKLIVGPGQRMTWKSQEL